MKKNLTSERSDVNRLGGKGFNLKLLTDAGYNVPPWFIVPVSTCRDFLKNAGIDQKLKEILNSIDFDNPKDLTNKSNKIQSLIKTRDITSRDYWRIFHQYNKTVGNDGFVAVRSSATQEDSAVNSFAGQMDTFLFVRGHEQIIKAIKGCWASAFSRRALTYHHLRNTDISSIETAVVVQKMIPPDIAGVMFTANPINSDTDEMVINATYGLGEGIVSGKLDTDNFIISRKGRLIRQETVKKEKQIVLDEKNGYGTREVDVEPGRQEVPCLGRRQIKALAKVAGMIESGYGLPQDIEFVINKKKIYILQSRPVTTLKKEPPGTGRKLIWDNSNIIESFSGVTSPLTFSFVHHAYTIVYEQFCRIMGVSKKDIKENRQIFSNMLGLIKGRVYYNLMNWYRLVSIFPGFKYNKGFMEQMMGLNNTMDFEPEKGKKQTLFRKYFIELPRLLLLLLRIGCVFLGTNRHISSFFRNFNKVYGEMNNKDYRSMPPHEIMDYYHEIEQKLLWNWQAPIITDSFAMIFYGLLKKLTTKWKLDDTGSLQNDLICGEKDVESALPTKMLLEIAGFISTDSAMKNLFKEKDEKRILDMIYNDKKYHKLKNLLEDYLNRYGFRGMNELKLEEPSLKDDPRFLITILKNYLIKDGPDPAAIDKREREVRSGAEAIVAGKLSGKFTFFGMSKLFIYNWVLKNARKNVKNRENLRFARTRIYGILREIANALGKHFQDRGILDEAHDIFYLELDEIWDLIRGTSTCTHLKELTGLRKREFDRYKQEEIDDHFETCDITYAGNDFKDKLDGKEEQYGENILKGISCCQGTVTAKAKVIRSNKDDMVLNGEILVAERTDPGWIPLYPSASAILIERGSILSHSAILARELGIPTIVGIKNLTKQVQTGQLIGMDGYTGIVNLNP